MKIINSLKTGLVRSVSIWKGVLIVWFCTLVLVSFIALPVKSVVNSGFGSSMITEKLKDGINVEVLGDLFSNLHGLISFFSTGLLLMILFGTLMNAFLAGGLFNGLKASSDRFLPSEFFRASAKNFWSFLTISLLLSFIIVLLAVLIVSVPLAIVGQGESHAEGAIFRTFIIVIPIFLFFLTILLLVADYARAWNASSERNAPFKAIGFGFGQTFRTFLTSFPLMIILLVVQALYACFVFMILSGLKPVTGGGVFQLFLLSQVLFFIRILLKSWRYGSVTVLMDITMVSPDQAAQVVLQPEVKVEY